MRSFTRRILNAKGRAKGFGGCLRCGDTWDWQQEHSTPYRFIPNSSLVVESCFPLCEGCWSSLTPEERLPFYDQLVDIWISDRGERARLYGAVLGVDEYEDQRALIHKAVLGGG